MQTGFKPHGIVVKYHLNPFVEKKLSLVSLVPAKMCDIVTYYAIAGTMIFRFTGAIFWQLSGHSSFLVYNRLHIYATYTASYKSIRCAK